MRWATCTAGSGDIPATFASLRAQIRSGLNVAVSGIPWWTTDIGGFHGGDPLDAEYRELIVRWFQYGALCPLFRLHGNREPVMPFGLDQTGGPNEPWSYGDESYEHIKAALLLRERLRPYIMTLMGAAHAEGIPPMRPLFVDFPPDAAAWSVSDQYMFGPDLLVAPVAEYGARTAGRGAGEDYALPLVFISLPGRLPSGVSAGRQTRGDHMLVLTETAAEVVKSVTSAPQSSQTAGLRISSSIAEPEEATALQVEAVSAPEAGDQVLEAAGAHVFVAPQAAGFLDDKVLDAQVDGAGNVRFSLAAQRPGDVL